MIKIYGIPNCSTVKKALSFLEIQNCSYEFFDFKKYKPTVQQLKSWKEAFGDWPINKRGLTYKKIKEQFESAKTPEKFQILIDNTSAIKRPILEKNNKVLAFGFDSTSYQKLF